MCVCVCARACLRQFALKKLAKYTVSNQYVSGVLYWGGKNTFTNKKGWSLWERKTCYLLKSKDLPSISISLSLYLSIYLSVYLSEYIYMMISYIYV
jgi:hypothetical protein